MKLEIYAVHDSAVGRLIVPFFPLACEAIRSFESAVNDPSNGFLRMRLTIRFSGRCV